MKVTIDPYAGFCFGVKNAVEIAENELQKKENLYCIGDIVHNQEEIDRLKSKGLEIANFESLPENKDLNILFRAHGEPPSSYDKIKNNKLNLIDGTCPIVLKLQQKIKDAYKNMRQVNGQVVIYGSKNHPEVVGLAGYTNDEALIIESMDDIDKINFNKPIRLFAQTTKDKEKYKLLKKTIEKKTDKINGNADYRYFNTICGQVSNRVPKLQNFCSENEIVIFVSGKKSSNGKFLFNICKSVNSNSYQIFNTSELKPEWFNGVNTAGISGATSTPLWLMKEIANHIKSL